MSWGRRAVAVLIAAWTSWAAVSMLFSRLNCRIRLVEPRALLEVIWVMPGMALNCTSSGVATDEAMVSGLAPGNWAVTWIVGKSASGKGATGRRGKAMTPSSTSANVSSSVAIGRSIHQRDSEPRAFMAAPGRRPRLQVRPFQRPLRQWPRA
ncbi:hypothetical protein D3C78_692160 [compost metagenome]